MNRAKLRAVEQAIARKLRDLFCFAGLAGGGALVSYGAWTAYPPAGFIVAGVLLVAGAWLHDRA